MRLMTGFALGLVGISGLAACGETDVAFRARYRTQAIQACEEGGRSSNPAGIDASRFCPCMVDRYMQATPSEQLKTERSQSTPPPAARAAIEQCARELLSTPAQTQAGEEGAEGNEQ